MIPRIILKKERGYSVPDRVFYLNNGRRMWCHPTPYEVFVGGDPDDENNWYNEYMDKDGETHYAH